MSPVIEPLTGDNAPQPDGNDFLCPSCHNKLTKEDVSTPKYKDSYTCSSCEKGFIYDRRPINPSPQWLPK